MISSACTNPLHRERGCPETSELVNPYHILHIRHDATLSEIRKSYQRLALFHHPGRKSESLSPEELHRRALVFEILAHCYETLAFYQERFDALLYRLKPPIKGQIYVGGKRMMETSGWCNIDQRDHVPALASSSSSDEEESEHYTHEDTNRMFAGPLELLFKARGFEPFSDPYDVFESVFGHDVFPRPTERHVRWLYVPETPPVSAAWTESTITRRDGSVVCLTSRILYDRKLTKTETTRTDSLGQKHVEIHVTSEPVQQVNDSDYYMSAGCCQATERCHSTELMRDGVTNFWAFLQRLATSCGIALFPQ